MYAHVLDARIRLSSFFRLLLIKRKQKKKTKEDAHLIHELTLKESIEDRAQLHFIQLAAIASNFRGNQEC